MIEKIDKLNRGEFIKFIENLIVNSDKYKRNNDNDAYVIALDSAWGTGKSYFVDLLIQDIEKGEKIQVVKYNAWENDYCDNAFNPLIYDILNSRAIEFSVITDADKANVKKLLLNIFNIGASVGKTLINDAIKNKTGVDLEKAIDKAFEMGKDVKNFMFFEVPNLAELNAQRESFSEFKKYLNHATEYLNDNDRKLVVIIDELDRCKPTFSIQTLEIVKHLFDIKNIIFLFTVDIQQLSHSISSIYGQGFDSVGYLCRFFDYIAKMPVPDIENYINDRIAEISTIPQIEVSSLKEKNKNCKFHEIISDFFFDIYKDFDFSLRDLDTVLQSYKIMLDNFLSEYYMTGAHMIYIFYLALKYKNPDIFYGCFVETSNYKKCIRTNLESFLAKVYNQNKWILATIRIMESDTKLQETTFLPGCNDCGDSNYNNSFRIDTVEAKKVIFRVEREGWGFYTESSLRNAGTSLGNVIFDPDLDKWEEIKHMTYREYLHKQLEMYNFNNINENRD